ncbi:MAG TPA: geopeptide radical SAM maturase, partial [Desulfurivibrionaceae bacterium]|nr:geopeptide radical SAM maturase [Desulfurivibrionaceae bacterium]
HYLLYSTKKGSLVRLSQGKLAAARADDLNAAERATLERLEIWCADPAAERAAMAGIVARSNENGRRFKATVVLTLDCNLACPYCFEGHFRGAYAMTAATAAQLVTFVQREQIDRGREVEIRFYGGEPLMAMPRLKEIARQLQDAATAAGTTFACSLVSNGTLLTRQRVEELLPLGLKSAQLTLDGPAALHDRQRPFVSGKGSYAAILANVRETYDMVTLKLGGNFSRDNYREFPRMLDDLLAAGIEPARLDPVQFAPVLPKSGVRAGHDCGCLKSSEPWLMEAHLYLREETLRRGFAVLPPTMGICMVEMANDLVVNWDGSLYKCPAFMGWPELAVGTLATGVGDYRDSHRLALWQNDDCLACPYLPICFGGCRLLPMLEHGAIDQVDCRREFYDACLEEMVRQVERSRRVETAT